MSFNGLEKWNPDYMRKYNLTPADIWKDTMKTRASIAWLYLLACLALLSFVIEPILCFVLG